MSVEFQFNILRVCAIISVIVAVYLVFRVDKLKKQLKGIAGQILSAI
jgi:hypothetical protein